jgi:hypothetical protein
VTTPIKIQSTEDGIELSQPCQSPEWSITGQGGRTDVVFITNDEIPRLLKVLRQRVGEEEEA